MNGTVSFSSPFTQFLTENPCDTTLIYHNLYKIGSLKPGEKLYFHPDGRITNEADSYYRSFIGIFADCYTNINNLHFFATHSVRCLSDLKKTPENIDCIFLAVSAAIEGLKPLAALYVKQTKSINQTTVSRVQEHLADFLYETELEQQRQIGNEIGWNKYLKRVIELWYLNETLKIEKIKTFIKNHEESIRTHKARENPLSSILNFLELSARVLKPERIHDCFAELVLQAFDPNGDLNFLSTLRQMNAELKNEETAKVAAIEKGALIPRDFLISHVISHQSAGSQETVRAE